MKSDQLAFRITQQKTKTRKCEEDNAQIQRHIDLRRMELQNKDDLIVQMRKELEHAKRAI